jgi:hypothetical protein
MVAGCGVKLDSTAVTTPGSSNSFMSFYEGSTESVQLRLANSGEVLLYCGSTYIGGTVGHTIGTGVWHYIELKATWGNPGTYEMRIDGETVLSGSAKTQAGMSGYYSAFQLSGSSNVDVYFTFDDFYCLDGSGATNNSFLGNMKVTALRPSSATASGWAPSSGTDNAAMVSESVVDDDATYIETATAGQLDLYRYDALAGVLDDIKGIQINTDARETDATTFNLMQVVRSGVSQDDGVASPIGTTTYATKRRIAELDPATGAAWTIAGLNAAEFGVKV